MWKAATKSEEELSEKEQKPKSKAKKRKSGSKSKSKAATKQIVVEASSDEDEPCPPNLVHPFTLPFILQKRLLFYSNEDQINALYRDRNKSKESYEAGPPVCYL